MRIIILAAGESKRFRDEGINVPKPFLMVTWRGRKQTMLQHVIDSIPLVFKEIAIAIPSGWLEFTKDLFILDTSSRMIRVREIQSKGPADTALQMLRRYIPKSTMFLDVDILNHPNDLYRLSRLDTCGVLVNWSANPAFSYVEKIDLFFHIAEKKQISEYAVRGAYFIPLSSLPLFIKHITETVQKRSEPFISHVFDSMPILKTALETTYTPVDWGTPRDLRISGASIEKGNHDARNHIH